VPGDDCPPGGRNRRLRQFSAARALLLPRRHSQQLEGLPRRQALYDTIFPRAEAAISYLEKFPLDDLPADALRLLQLLYSLILASFAVEIWRQPYIPDTGTASFDLKLEPFP
jgi:hypothetical protein